MDSIKFKVKMWQIIWYNFGSSFLKMYLPVDKTMKIVFKNEKYVWMW